MSLALNTMNNDTLTESLDRLAQLAVEGVRSYTARCEQAEKGLLPRVSRRQEDK